MEPPRTRVAYIVGRYPAVSHAFVTREVMALRAAGAEVETISVHQATAQDALSETDRAERKATYALLPPRWGDLLRAHLLALASSPSAYLTALSRALRGGPPGLKRRLWQLFYFAEGILVWRHCRRRGIHHLHAHHLNQASDAAMLAVEYANAAGSDPAWTWSFTMHGPNELYDVSHFRLEEKASSAAAVVCISDFARSQVMAFASVDAWSRLPIVHCGVDPSEYEPNREPADRSDGDFRVLCIGRLVPFKGQGLLVEAIAALRSRGIDARLNLVGEGPSRGRIEDRVHELGLDGTVELTGAIGQDEIRSHYARTDVFCLPSFAEGVPVVLMEAMAMRVPVVTTRIMGISELVDDGIDGVLIRPGRLDQLVEALARLADDPDLGSEMGRHGRQKVIEKFDVRESGRRLRRIFSAIS